MEPGLGASPHTTGLSPGRRQRLTLSALSDSTVVWWCGIPRSSLPAQELPVPWTPARLSPAYQGGGSWGWHLQYQLGWPGQKGDEDVFQVPWMVLGAGQQVLWAEPGRRAGLSTGSGETQGPGAGLRTEANLRVGRSTVGRALSPPCLGQTFIRAAGTTAMVRFQGGAKRPMGHRGWMAEGKAGSLRPAELL